MNVFLQEHVTVVISIEPDSPADWDGKIEHGERFRSHGLGKHIGNNRGGDRGVTRFPHPDHCPHEEKEAKFLENKNNI